MLMEYDLKLLHIETKANIEITGTINIGWVNCNVIYLPYGLKLLCPIMDDVLIFFIINYLYKRHNFHIQGKRL